MRYSKIRIKLSFYCLSLFCFFGSCSQHSQNISKDKNKSNTIKQNVKIPTNSLVTSSKMLKKEKPNSYFKTWQFDNQLQLITFDENQNKIAQKTFVKKDKELRLGFEEHIAKGDDKTPYTPSSPFAILCNSQIQKFPLSVNREPFSGTLIGVHMSSGHRILEVHFCNGVATNWKVWTDKQVLYTRTCTPNKPLKNSYNVRKPIIYLYPQKEQKVTLKVHFKGQITHSYPKYNAQKGWEVLAKPSGELLDLNTNKSYPYLFWEGQSNFKYTLKEGSVIAGENTIDFLEKSLAEMGLNRRETTDFITYWLPYLEANPYNLIHFSTTEYTQNAPLKISPQPETLLRVFMVYKPLNEAITIKKQSLVKTERKGFTVVEWGGKMALNPLF